MAVTATSRTSAPSPMTGNGNHNSSTTAISNSPAIESTIDAHASRILRLSSPKEACIDPSLGPFVTSMLRCSLSDNTNLDRGIDEIAEFESLMELLQEHCMMSEEAAKMALQKIYVSVRTGKVDHTFTPASSYGSSLDGGMIGSSGAIGDPVSKQRDAESKEEDIEAISLLTQALREAQLDGVEEYPKEARTNTMSEDSTNFIHDHIDPVKGSTELSGTMFERNATLEKYDGISGTDGTSGTTDNDYDHTSPSKSPLKPTTLIPADLLAVMDDPSTPATKRASKQTEKNEVVTETGFEQNFSFSSSNSSLTKSQSQAEPALEKAPSREVLAQDLAASLFRPARSRSNSTCDKSPIHRTLPATTSPGNLNLDHMASYHDQLRMQQQLDSVAQMLLSMNVDLSEEAAFEAALISNVDVNVAQYVLDRATNAPPVCRHMLNNACYRSDCQFSHDVNGHTCLFWMRGRCGKGENCRFLHGFNQRLLDGMKTEEWEENNRKGFNPRTSLNSQSTLINTTNLVHHNMMSVSPPGRERNLFSFLPSSNEFNRPLSAAEVFGSSSTMFFSTPQSSRLTTSSMHTPTQLVGTTNTGENRPPSEKSLNLLHQQPTFSFASVASKGYSKSCFTEKDTANIVPGGGSSANNSRTRPDNFNKKYAKIPQDLWNPSHNRNSALFHIPDPIQRYNELSTLQLRQDVIDLHFQSLKTFHIVLSAVLPEKLREHREVWIVTGSGHHVDRNSHQKNGGVLENAVQSWLQNKGYNFLRGRDRNGYGGAVLVKGCR